MTFIVLEYFSLQFFSNFITDCPNGRDEQFCADCTFEKDLCQWLDISIGPFAWNRDKAANIVQNNVGPSVDRTYRLKCHWFLLIFIYR